MIALNELNEYAAEIPFTLPLISDPVSGLTGHAFVLGEVQIKLPGASLWTNVAVDHIVEKGYGRYCVRLTSSQTTTAGIVSLRASVTDAQPFFGYELLGTLGGDVAVAGTGYLPFFLPNESDPVYGTAVTGANFSSSGTLRICLPGVTSVYRDATPTEASNVIELGAGGYAFVLDPSLTATRGKVFLYAAYPGAQRFEGYATVLGLSSSTAPVASSPVPSPVSFSAPEYVNHIRRGLDRLPQQFKSGVIIDESVTLDMILGGEI